jgi:hypothetical protein
LGFLRALERFFINRDPGVPLFKRPILTESMQAFEDA